MTKHLSSLVAFFQRALPFAFALWLLTSSIAHGQAVSEKDLVNRKKTASSFTPKNSQLKGQEPISPQAALDKISVPKGFNVTLFASEPDVRQPIDMTTDSRGRLWVAESYSYNGSEWTENKNDRILILEDTNGDGQHDSRKIFRGGFNRLSSIELGFGGVWILSDTKLQFIADRNSDDIPDGDPVVLIEGWTTKAHHNNVNGLTWGPDGWLYGRHGMKATSRVGPPGTPDAKRIGLDCSIWRFHPTDHRFQIVSRGMVNPWGLDFDKYGQMFVTNNVNGHLWHVMHGALFERTGGTGYAPYAFERLLPTADHFHFAGSWQQGWGKSRGSEGEAGRLGGGHSHCGRMIYLGDNWPSQYRNTIFLCNTHGHRVNNDRIEWQESKQKAGYVGRHSNDFLLANDTWFRGVSILYGPDGAVYLSDWSDMGECHDRDGVHRTSGRIYKISYGKPNSLSTFDLKKQTDEQLVQLQLHNNEWFARQARQLLHARAAENKDMAPAVKSLRSMFDKQTSVSRKLRILWCLHALNAADSVWLQELLKHPEAPIRSWSVRLLAETHPISGRTAETLAHRAETDQSDLVLLQLASSLQHIPVQQRSKIAMPLVTRLNDARHRQLTLMTWYAIEPVVAANPKVATELLSKSSSPLLRQFIARRLSEK